MVLDLRKLDHALTVHRLGSFTLAGEELRLTQSALSRSIASLEAAWGARIFERNRMGVIATPLGEVFVQEAGRLLAEANALDHNMTLRGGARVGAVAFGMGPYVGGLLMAEVLMGVSRLSPELKISSVIKRPVDLVADVWMGRLEFAVFCEVSLAELDEVEVDDLCEIPMGYFVRSNHVLTDSQDVRFSDLRKFPLMISQLTDPEAFSELCTIMCDEPSATRDLMFNSDTVAYLSPWMVRAELRSGALCRLDNVVDCPAIPSSLCVVSAKRKLRSPGAALLIGTLKELLPGWLAEW